MDHKTALVIDDDPLFRMLTEELLISFGISEVEVAADGKAALEALKAKPSHFDLCICDLQMPDLDGISCIRELASLGFKGRLIIASGEEDAVLRTVLSMAKMLGVQVLGALPKPIDRAAFEGLLKADSVATVKRVRGRITRADVKDAIAARSIVPFYQPKLDIRSGQIKSFEVLSRIRQPDGSFQPPQDFIDAAERFALIGEVTNVIIDQVIADLLDWSYEGLEPNVAINMCPTTLVDLDLPDRLADCFQSVKIDPSRVTLEITENRLLDYGADVLEVLSRCRLKGFRLSVDDFGTGATSIEQLRLYPFNELKIDRSFVLRALEDDFARTTVETSIKLASMLNMPVVAEGVETLEHLRFVGMAGAHTAQGYLIAKALPGEELVEWMEINGNRFGKKEEAA